MRTEVKEALLKYIPLWLPLVTALGYLTVFIYGAGTYAAFKLPLELIPMDLSSILVGISIVTGLFFMLYMIADSYLSAIKIDHADPLGRRLAIIWPFWIYGYASMAVLGFGWHMEYVLIIGSVGFVTYLAFISPLKYIGISGYRNKLAEADLHSNVKDSPVDNLFKRKIGLSLPPVILVCGAYLSFVFFAGEGQVYRTKDVYTPINYPGYAAVSISANQVILKKYNSQDGVFLDEIKVLTPDNIQGYTKHEIKKYSHFEKTDIPSQRKDQRLLNLNTA